MGELDALFASNRAWAHAMKQSDTGFFERLSRQQAPQFLWIGCSDSRVLPTRSSASRRASCSCIATSRISPSTPI